MISGFIKEITTKIKSLLYNRMNKDRKDTKTTKFLLPCLGFTKDELGTEFENAYLGHYQNTTYEVLVLFLLFSKIPNKQLLNSSVEYYKVEGDKYILVFSIPERFINDYHTFLESKYSKLSPELKMKICEFHGKISEPYNVVSKNQERKIWLEKQIGEPIDKDAELMSLIEERKEVLKIEYA